MSSTPLACRILGHRPRFRAEGRAMHWDCGRGCGMTGSKTYPTAADAARYAAALDRDERADIGKRAPLSMFLLRLVRRRRT